MKFNRILEKNLKNSFFGGKSIIVVGARQVGKTTLLNKVSENCNKRLFNCDNPTERELLENRDLEFLKGLVEDVDLILIDEAQRVSTIGQTIKLLVDHYGKKKQIIATGSSSMNLLDNTTEPLTGRKYVYHLYPLYLKEVYKNKVDSLKHFDENLIFGAYPEVKTLGSFVEKISLLKELSTSYLYKDILEFQQVKNPNLLFNLLKALALQLGNEVSYKELSDRLGIDLKTVERYIDLLEKSFVIFRLPPYKHNKRRTISKRNKIYFFDLGIRNALINNFNLPDSRNDTGELFENHCILERMKLREYKQFHARQYFFRTYDRAEVDLVEEKGGKLYAYEFKLKPKRLQKKGWDSYEVIHKENLWEFLK